MEVNVTKRINTPQGKRYCSVVVNGSGRIKPDWVIVDGKHQNHRGAGCAGRSGSSNWRPYSRIHGIQSLVLR